MPALETAMAPDPTFRRIKDRIAKRDLLFPARVEEVARLCLDRPEVLAFSSTNHIAKRAGVSSSTVLRFVNMIGFSNIKEARETFQNEVRFRSRFSKRN
ncbi:MurR/RpiR family transcriptional regulator [Rhizobium gallicum]|uniref:RpiR family transcriptional regulator n=1 Tax=Rhizobium gallicum TaxID=56730 RepID=UPI001939591F|nr:RpiR family transcriptional regulator [Rhizobium gallicum]